jgi:hypothetical protein
MEVAVTIAPITAARLRCIGLGVYCMVLAVVGFVPALVALYISKMLLAFGNLWAEESDMASAKYDEARAKLLDLVAEQHG